MASLIMAMSRPTAAAVADVGDNDEKDGGRPSNCAAYRCHSSCLLLPVLLLLAPSSCAGNAFIAKAIMTAVNRSYDGANGGKDCGSCRKMLTRGDKVLTAHGNRTANKKSG